MVKFVGLNKLSISLSRTQRNILLSNTTRDLASLDNDTMVGTTVKTLKRSKSMSSLTYKVLLDENWDYCMHGERPYRACIGTFDTYEQARQCAQGIVNGNLSDAIDRGKTAEEALLNWSIHGSEPFIRPGPPLGIERFSARNYARQRSADIVDGLAKLISRHEAPLVEELGASGLCEMSNQGEDDDRDCDHNYDGFAYCSDDEWAYDKESQHSTQPVPLHQLKQVPYPSISTGLIVILVIVLVVVLLVQHSPEFRRLLWGAPIATKPRFGSRLLAPLVQHLRDGTCHQFLFC